MPLKPIRERCSLPSSTFRLFSRLYLVSLELSIQGYSRVDTFSSQKLPAVALGCMGAAALEAFDLRPALCGVVSASTQSCCTSAPRTLLLLPDICHAYVTALLPLSMLFISMLLRAGIISSIQSNIHFCDCSRLHKGTKVSIDAGEI